MFLSEGHYRCDAEIGKPGCWRGCKRKATVRGTFSDVVGYYFLDYCERHANRLDEPRTHATKMGVSPL